MPKWKTVELKLKNKETNITFDEIISLLEHFGYLCDNKGKTSGSRVRFIKEGYADILIHRPHPQKELKKYVVKDLHDILVQEGLL